jgi:four helix bundle protein
MRDHKSLEAWIEAAAVVRAVFGVTKRHWAPNVAAILAQVQRSCLSVQLNIAEGYALSSPGRMRSHYEIAYGSAIETGELIELLLEEKMIPIESLPDILQRCRRSQRLLLGLIKHVRRL